jgi:hypothetical protein
MLILAIKVGRRARFLREALANRGQLRTTAVRQKCWWERISGHNRWWAGWGRY